MKERINEYDPYEEWGETRPTRSKLTRFRDEFSSEDRAKSVSERRRQPLKAVAKKTLLDRPDSASLTLIKESNIPLGLLSSHSIEMLESDFTRAFQSAEITDADLFRWLNGEEVANQQRVISQIRGRLFEEVTTREFVKRNPNYFVTNPVLTSKIIGPIIVGQKRREFVMPDHLVFLKDARVATLVGFIEDKKAVRFNADSELFEQLEAEWGLFSLIADSDDIQAQFRREAQKNIPSLPYRIRVAPIHEGTIWLATAKGASRGLGQLPRWVTLFESSVSGEMINQLAGSLITKRFLPRLSSSFVKSSERD